MAMVFLSDRKMSAIQEKQEPYTFINNELKNELEELNVLLEKKAKENKAPFNTQAKGHDIKLESKQVPGPGAYNLDQPKKLSNYAPGSFIFKSQRFKKIKNELNIPGPGAYNIIGNKFSLKRNRSQIRPSSNISNQFTINSVNNVATIPAKKQEYGYNINNNGDLVVAPDPIADFCFSGTKSDSIGPGRYNPIIKEKNHCIRWDKSSGRKPDNLFGINTDNVKSEVTQNTSLIDTDISTLKSNNERKKPKPKPFKIITYKSIRNSSITQDEEETIDIRKEIDFLNHRNNIISGPKKSRNYLYNFNMMRHPSKPDEFQFFGSSNKRNTSETLILSTNTKVGPGSYFRNTFKKFENYYLNRNPKNSSEKPKESEEKYKLRRSWSNVGPGSYNINRSLQKKSFNSFGNFSTEKRFDLSYMPNTYIENIDSEICNPGPGSYNINDSWIKDIRKKVKKPILVNVDEEVKKSKKIKKIEKKADFNNYQNEGYVNIIQEKIRKRTNRYNADNNPFLSGDNRFKYINSDNYENIGPGKYNILKNGQKSRLFYSILAPFNSLEERKPIYMGKANNFVAPGEHRKDSYFDWNKKSFNAMFMN